MRELLELVKRYIEITEETIEGESGAGRSLAELIRDGSMPEVYDLVLLNLAEIKDGMLFDSIKEYL